MLPVGATVSHRLPQFRGTFMNSVRNAAPLEKGMFKKANAWRKTFGRRVILESFVETSEDYDYGSLHTMQDAWSRTMHESAAALIAEAEAAS